MCQFTFEGGLNNLKKRKKEGDGGRRGERKRKGDLEKRKGEGGNGKRRIEREGGR